MANVVMDETWLNVIGELTRLVVGARPGRFVLVDANRDRYGTQAPYVQGTPGSSGWYLELSFMAAMPFGHHEPVRAWLLENDWNEPDGGTLNWWRQSIAASDVPGVMIASLRNGYNCEDPSTYLFDTGSVPTGPRGGEPLPVTDTAARVGLRVA